MTDFTLSTKRPSAGRSSGGLNPSFLPSGGGAVAGLRAGHIDPNAGQIGYTPAPIPAMVENQTSKGVQEFLGTTADAAFKYQQREAQFFANAAALDFAEAANNAYNGYEDADGNFIPGYASKQGSAARPAYYDYKTGLEETFQAALENLEPRAKQMALLQMQGTKNQYLAKGATHRVAQDNIAAEEQRIAMRDSVVTRMAADPTMLVPDANGQLPFTNPHTKSTILSEYLNTFTSLQDAYAALPKTLQQVTEKLYLDSNKDGSGYKSAKSRAFLDNVAGPLMQTSEAGLAVYTSTADSLRRWELREVQNDLSHERLNRENLAREKKAMQESNLAKGLSMSGQKGEWTEADWRYNIANGFVEPTKGSSAMQSRFGQTIRAAAPDDAQRWINNIENSFMENGVRVYRRRDGTTAPLYSAWHGDDMVNQDNETKSYLEQLYKKVDSTNYTDVTAIMKELTAAYADKFGNKFLTRQTESALRVHRMTIEHWASAGNMDRQQLRAQAMEELWPASDIPRVQDMKGIEGITSNPKEENLPNIAAQIEANRQQSGESLYNLQKAQYKAYKKGFQAEETARLAKEANERRLRND